MDQVGIGLKRSELKALAALYLRRKESIAAVDAPECLLRRYERVGNWGIFGEALLELLNQFWILLQDQLRKLNLLDRLSGSLINFDDDVVHERDNRVIMWINWLKVFFTIF